MTRPIRPWRVAWTLCPALGLLLGALAVTTHRPASVDERALASTLAAQEAARPYVQGQLAACRSRPGAYGVTATTRCRGAVLPSPAAYLGRPTLDLRDLLDDEGAYLVLALAGIAALAGAVSARGVSSGPGAIGRRLGAGAVAGGLGVLGLGVVAGVALGARGDPVVTTDLVDAAAVAARTCALTALLALAGTALVRIGGGLATGLLAGVVVLALVALTTSPIGLALAWAREGSLAAAAGLLGATTVLVAAAGVADRRRQRSGMTGVGAEPGEGVASPAIGSRNPLGGGTRHNV